MRVTYVKAGIIRDPEPRRLWRHRRSTGAQTTRSNPCLICLTSIPWFTAGCA